MLNGILEEMTSEDVAALNPEVGVIAVGSTEPHGPHMPYGTDYYICDGVIKRAVPLANEQGARVLALPTLPIGNNVNFKAMRFACRMSVRSLMLVVLDLIQALEEDGLRKIVIVNHHGGNTQTLQAVLREHYDRKGDDGAFVCFTAAGAFASEDASALIDHTFDHAGEGETSQIMYLRGELVAEDKRADNPEVPPKATFLDDPRAIWVRPWNLFLPEGAGGDSRKATKAKGEAMIESSAEGLADFLVKLSKAPWTQNFPYA